MNTSIEIGNTYNNLKAIKRAGKNKHRQALFEFECLLCGNKVIKVGTLVKTGNTKSCGCLTHSTTKRRTHYKSDNILYHKWANMKWRCKSTKAHNYHRYGGRGIKVCERWLNSFENFYDDMHEGYFKGAEIDRIDNDGNYEPSNCRWVTREENMRNKTNRNNKTGHTGISFRKDMNKYTAYAYVNRKTIYIGSFVSLEEAVIARKKFIKNMRC